MNTDEQKTHLRVVRLLIEGDAKGKFWLFLAFFDEQIPGTRTKAAEFSHLLGLVHTRDPDAVSICSIMEDPTVNTTAESLFGCMHECGAMDKKLTVDDQEPDTPEDRINRVLRKIEGLAGSLWAFKDMNVVALRA